MLTLRPADWFEVILMLAALATAGGLVSYWLRRRRRWRTRELDSFFEQIRDAAIITGCGKVVEANEAALDLFGYPREQFIGLAVARLLADPGDEKRFVRALADGPVTDFPLRLKTAHGDLRACAVTASARFDARGNMIGCRGLARDVTARNQMLTELRRAEHDYHGLFDNAHDAILILDRFDETVLEVNGRACLLYGVPREQFIGRSMIELSVDARRGAMLMRETREGHGLFATFESQQRRSDGTIIDVEINAAEVVYKGRRGILSINRDISARRKAEQAVRESEARFRLLLESVTDYAIVMLDPAGRIASWNEGAQRTLGYTEEEVLGRSPGMFAPPEETDTIEANLEKALAAGRLELSTVGLRKDGSRFAASVMLTPMVDEAGSLHGFALVTHDVTEHEQLEEVRKELVAVLKVVAEEWTQTFDAVLVPVVMLDGLGEIRRLNQAAQALTGRGFSGLIHTRAADIEGQPWPTIARLAAQTIGDGALLTERAVEGGAVWEVTSSLAGSGENRRAIVVAYDLTVVTRLEAWRRQNEVAAEMGTMVSAVAHEVRNPLFTISAIVEAWSARYGGHEGAARYEAPLREQIQRLNRLMADLLDYGNPNPLRMVAASLADAIRAAIADCALVQAQSSARIEVDVAPDLPLATIDPPRIGQVLQNVIDNALRHSPPGGRVRVEARYEDDGFTCRVIDEGPGLAAEDLQRAFLPFFTRRHGGTGLGLAIARKIVTAHGGEIALGSAETGGTVVTIRLPRHRHLPVLEARAEAS